MPKKAMTLFLFVPLLLLSPALQAAHPTIQPGPLSDLQWLGSAGVTEKTALRWFQFTDIWKAIRSSSEGGLSLATVLPALGRLGLTENQARRVIAALSAAAQTPSDMTLSEGNKEHRRSELERVFPQLLDVYLSAPSNPAVAELIESFFGSATVDRARFEEQFLDGFGGLDHPVQAALAYSQHDRTADFMLERLLGKALILHPGHPLLLLALVDEDRLYSDAITKSAFLEATYNLAQASGQPNGNLLRVVGERWIVALLEGGLTERAIDTLNRFPTDLRQSLEAGDHGNLELEWEGAVGRFELHDVALDIACAYLLEGLHAAAGEVLAKYRIETHWSQPDAPGWPELQRQRHRLKLARVAAGLDRPQDQFDFIASFFDSSLGDAGLGYGTLQHLPWKLLLSDYLRSSGISSLADNLSRQAASDLDSILSPTDSRRAFRTDPSPLQRAGLDSLATIADGLRVEGRQLHKELSETLSQGHAQHRTADLLDTPRTVSFHQILDGNLLPPTLQLERLLEVSRQLVAACHPPAGFHPLTADRQGNRLWVVASSPALDPSSDRDPEGYWLLRSENGGKDWLPPLYMGLQVASPYSITESSWLNIEDDDSFRVQTRARLNTANCAPPGGGPDDCGWVNLGISFAVADLERDSDGDGLTDLVEERVASDPIDPDTDDDGLSDAVDPMPQIEQSPRDDVRTAALKYPLESLIKEGQETLYLVADPRDIQGVELDQRIVVLSPREARQLRSKFSTAFTPELSVVLFDAGMDRCLVVWTSERRGGSFKMRRTGTTWICEGVSNWLGCG